MTSRETRQKKHLKRVVRLLFAGTGIEDVEVLAAYDRRKSWIGFKTHVHDSRRLEICYLAKGRQTYIAGDRPYTMTGGDVLTILPNDVHGADPAPLERGIDYSLVLRIPDPGCSFLNLPAPHGRNLADALLNLPSRHFAGSPVMRDHLDAVIEAFHVRDADPLAMVRAHNRVAAFLLEVVRCGRAGVGHGISPWAGRVIRHINEHIGEPLTMEELARKGGLSVSHFKSRFRRELGVPPGEYVTWRRIEAAKSLLMSRKQTITDIALQLGFSSSQYFATAFRSHTGRTPRQFRQSARGR